MAASILQTGVYTITNKYFHNGVFLRANDESKTLRAKASSDDDCSKVSIRTVHSHKAHSLVTHVVDHQRACRRPLHDPECRDKAVCVCESRASFEHPGRRQVVGL